MADEHFSRCANSEVRNKTVRRSPRLTSYFSRLVQVPSNRQDQHNEDQQTEGRPTVVAPTARVPKAASQQRQEQEHDQQGEQHFRGSLLCLNTKSKGCASGAD